MLVTTKTAVAVVITKKMRGEGVEEGRQREEAERGNKEIRERRGKGREEEVSNYIGKIQILYPGVEGEYVSFLLQQPGNK